MSYQQLAEGRKSLRVDWYRCPMKLGTLLALSQKRCTGMISGWRG